MTPPTTPGQDGGEQVLLSEEAVERAAEVYESFEGDVLYDAMAAALAAVAPDLVRAERDRVRGECAEELLAAVADGYLPVEAAKFLAHRWRTPDPAS